jgi:putative addiction module component (TIGR02574 family)
MLLDEIKRLSIAERIELMEQIWETITPQADQIELTEAQRRELDRRLAALEADPDAGSSWDEVKQRILKRA